MPIDARHRSRDGTSRRTAPVRAPDATELPSRVYTAPFAKLRSGKARYGIMLRDDVLFDRGKSVLKKQGKTIIQELASNIQRDYPRNVIYIDGHTDNTPIKKSKNADNWELGAKRAHAVFKEFVALGFDKKFLRLSSSGWAQPVPGVNPDIESGRRQCRRVEIRLGDTIE